MFKVHRVGSNNLSVKNLILLFFTIVLGFGSLITLAQISISSDINNAWQTIQRISITNDGTDNGTTYRDFNYDGNGHTLINGLDNVGIFSGKILGIDEGGNLISVISSNLVISGGNDDRTIAGNDMYATHTGNIGIGTNTPTGKLQIVNSGSTDVYIEEQGSGSAANLYLKNLITTWTLGGDSDPNYFYIGETTQPAYFVIKQLGNVGIGTITPAYKLDISGDVRTMGNMIASGSIRFGNITTTCSSSNQGSMRYTGACFQGCDGSSWVNIGGSGCPPMCTWQ